MSVILSLILLLGGVEPQNCWAVYSECRRLAHNRLFVTHMTGPGGRLWLLVGGRPAKQKIPIRPNDVWLLRDLDPDDDGDIDLRDYAEIQNTWRPE